MSESQGGAGRREVAYRLLATEFDDADFSYSQSDEERAPNYVVTPTGARVNRLFVVGVLTEIETVSEDYLRARVVDPTGPFVIYAGQYQPDALAFLERAEPPAFVAVTGKARTYQPDDSDRVFTSIRPESMSEVEAATRDRWVVQTAEQTLHRVARMAEAKETGLAGDDLQTALESHGVDDGLAAGIPLALDHYGTTGDYLAALRATALDSARVVAGEIDEAEPLTLAPDAGGDESVAELVERPIDVDAAERTTDAEAQPAETEDTDEAVAEASAGNGSAIGTAAASGQETATREVATGSDEPTQSDASTAEPAAGTGEVDTAAADTDTDEADGDATETASAGTDRTAEPDRSTETEPVTESEPSTARNQSTESDEETASSESVTGDSSGTAPDLDGSSAEDDDLEDFEPEFDLDEDERDEIEAEFGTEFQSGSEVDEPGSADIDTPDPETTTETADVETDETAEGTAEATAAEPSTDIDPVAETEPSSDESAAESDGASEPEPTEDTGDALETEPAEDVDLEDAVMDAMTDLDEGDGANRDEVLTAVVDRTGADPGDVDDAIQDALMGGRCYEPDDATLKPI